jgi:hypothetical protein
MVSLRSKTRRQAFVAKRMARFARNKGGQDDCSVSYRIICEEVPQFDSEHLMEASVKRNLLIELLNNTDNLDLIFHALNVLYGILNDAQNGQELRVYESLHEEIFSQAFIKSLFSFLDQDDNFKVLGKAIEILAWLVFPHNSVYQKRLLGEFGFASLLQSLFENPKKVNEDEAIQERVLCCLSNMVAEEPIFREQVLNGGILPVIFEMLSINPSQSLTVSTIFLLGNLSVTSELKHEEEFVKLLPIIV